MLDLILDIIFPQNECCLCREPGNFWSRRPWCDKCDEELRRVARESPVCQVCGKFLTVDQAVCSECQEEKPPFFIARAVGPYEGCFRKVVKMFKFLGKRGLAVRMSKMMAEVVLSTPEYGELDVIVPVPATRESLARRGFNQSELLARRLASQLGVRFRGDVLVRLRETPPQRELSKEERERNLKGAFAVQNRDKIKDKRVLLVDDVYTTGSTAKECSRVLLEAGAASVAVVTWASGKGY